MLFADLAGFTTVASAVDAEEAHALLEAFFGRVDHIVTEHGGHVDKHIGDCVMAVFGAPVAYGNDAARAVAAALAIRDAMPALSTAVRRSVGVHIGIAGGQVVASGTGSAAHREYTVTGDTVNLASRLTDAAASGEILISDAIRMDLADRLQLDCAGDIAVKGLAAPVRTWRLSAMSAPAPEGNPLVGRRGELAQLAAALATCRESGRGQAVLVRGEAGIGKTRIVEELQRTARDLGFACHSALVLDFGAGTGRDAIRTLLRSLLGLNLSSPATAVAARAVAEGMVPKEDEVFLNDLLDLPQPTDLRALYDAMDNAHRNRGKRAVVARVVERASQSRPRLLVVEDVHWADRLTLAHLARTAVTATECPAVLLLTTRLEGDPIDPTWRADAAGVALTTIDVGPLRSEDAHVLALSVAARSTAFADRCVERAAGNPFFLEQLLRHGEESGLGAAVPGSVQSLVQARVDRLDPADKAALQAASALGQRFECDALGHMLGREDYAPERLVERRLLRAQDGATFLFAHALVRDAVYDSLLKSRRRELHRAAAAWFAGRDAVLRAEHLDRAEAPDAAAAYLEAAKGQIAEFRYESARRLIGRGLELATELRDVFALLCLQGETLHDLGAMAEARQAYEAALKQAADDAERCAAWLSLVACKRVTDDLAGAQADLDLAEAAAAQLGLAAISARVHFLAGSLCFPRGDIEGCLCHHQRSLALAQEIGSAQHEAAALGGLGDAEYVRGRMISAQDRYERCIALCRQHALGRIEAAHRQMLGLTQFFRNDVRGALADALAAADAARRIGQQRGEMVAHLIAAEMHANLGQQDEARAQLDDVERLIRQLGALRFEPLRLNCLAKTLRADGRNAEAVVLLKRSVQVSRETALSFSGPSALGALALTTDEAATRREAIEEGESLLRAGSVAHNHFRFYRDTIDATLRAGDWGDAERLAAALETFAAAEPLPWTDFYIARGRALAAWGRGERTGATMAELRRLAAEAQSAGLLLALPALEGALSG